MRSDVNRLTLRNVDPTLKRALMLRAQHERESMERTILLILKKELVKEVQAIEMLDHQLEQSVSS